MEFVPSVPIYLQVLEYIKYDIVTAKLKQGEKLPSVRELALEYAINPNTASRVYRMLEEEGISFTKRGMGTFVTEDAETLKKLKQQIANNLAKNYLSGMARIGSSVADAINLLKEFEKNEEIL